MQVSGDMWVGSLSNDVRTYVDCGSFMACSAVLIVSALLPLFCSKARMHSMEVAESHYEQKLLEYHLVPGFKEYSFYALSSDPKY